MGTENRELKEQVSDSLADFDDVINELYLIRSSILKFFFISILFLS